MDTSDEGEDYNGPESLIYGADYFNYGEIFSRFGETCTANDEIKDRIKECCVIKN